MSGSAGTSPGLLASVRQLASHALELARLRLELLVVELAEERDRIARLLVVGLFAFFFVGFGLIALAVLLTVMWWDTQRLLPLALLTSFFLGAGLVCALLLLRALMRGSTLFAASVAELSQDCAALKDTRD